MHRAAFFVALSLLPAAALAQDAAYRRFLEQTNAAAPPPALDALRQPALETLQGNARGEGRCVPSALTLERLESATAVRVITQSVRAGQIRNGWTFYGRAAGCPEPFLGHFLAARMADGSLRVLLVNEGETLANPSLMRDMGHLAALAATNFVRRAAPACDGADLRMGPTRIVDRSRLGAYAHGAYFSGSWREAWTFTVCGRRVEVPVSFTADAQGGADYSVEGTAARILD
ncbi:MAG TPA: hypothetical protein VGW40_10275 [Allosphingosinicella sp.]|nr:hypothetical protein [Allosphingosinicella sp.]